MSRVARLWSTWRNRALVVALLALTGCGGHWQPTFQPTGLGQDQYWTVQAHGKPKAVVVLLHGLGQDSGEARRSTRVDSSPITCRCTT